MSRSRLWCAVTLVALFAGCADEPTAPFMKAQKTFSAEADVQRHVVALKSRNGSAAFEAAVTAAGGTVEAKLNGIGGVIVSGLSDDVVISLRGHRDVLAIDAEELIPMRTRSSAPVALDMAELQSVTAPNTAFLFSWQWNMRAVGAQKVWAAGKLGSSGVKVAILDTGLDTRSLDANGLIDLPNSKSFVEADDKWVEELFPTRPLISDLHGHGTNVASQVSSTAIVFAGVTSRTRLLGVKVCSHALEGCPTAAVLSGIVYAVDKGADVINLSLGGAFLKRHGGSTVALLNRVFQYAEQRGVTVVAAAGNEGVDMDHVPNAHFAYCDQTHVICVSATGATKEVPLDNVDQFAVYSNFGTSRIDVAAPGGNAAFNDRGEAVSAAFIYSICSSSSADLVRDKDKKVIALKPGFCAQPGVFLAGQVGTSQAAPHVAGLAALLIAQHGRNPALIRHIIRNTADDLGKPGMDPQFGQGRINVASALGL